jgi:DNA-binding transcriptional ArsR family regulator
LATVRRRRQLTNKFFYSILHRVTRTARALAEPETIAEPRRAAALLHPLRGRILQRAHHPCSATELAAELGLPRQNVTYHLRALHAARLVRRAGRRQKRGFVEQRWVATSQSYVLLPEVLGAMGAAAPTEDTVSTATLLAIAGRMQSELARGAREARAAGKVLPTLSIDAELRFASAAQREAFAVGLRDALARLVAEHTVPARLDDGRAPAGRPYRLVVGSYPVVSAGGRTQGGTSS